MKRGILFVLISFLTISLFSQARHTMGSAAQAPGSVSGKIYDSQSQKPMEYANVTLYRMADSSLVTGTISGADGSYVLKDVPPGKYYIEIGFIGFDKAVIDNVLINQQSKNFRAPQTNLNPTVAEIEGVEVVGKRNYIEYQIDKKVVNVSQDIASSGGSAVDVLQNAPSVNVDIEGNLSLRGSSSFRVLINGKPQVLDGNDLLKQIPATSIENIEIITNPSAKYDPDGNSGIINVVTKKSFGEGFSGIVNASVGTNDKYNSDLTLNYKTDKFKVFAGGNWTDQTYRGEMVANQVNFDNDSIPRIVTEGKRNHIRNNWQTRGGVEVYLSPKTNLTLTATYGEFSNGGNRNARITNYQDLNYEKIDSLGRNISTDLREGYFYSGNLGFEQLFKGENHRLTSDFSWNYEETDDIEDLNEFVRLSDTLAGKSLATEGETENEIRGKIDYERPLAFGARMETGYQLRYDQETEDNTLDKATYNPDTTNELRYTTLGFSQNIQSVYATVSHSLAGFKYQAGIRVEYTDRRLSDSEAGRKYIFNKVDYFPSVYITRALPRNFEVRANYGRRIERPGGRSLEPFPSYMTATKIRIGNPYIEPEYINAFELGIQKNFGSSFVSLEGYHRATNNKITQLQFGYSKERYDHLGLSITDTAQTIIFEVQNVENDNSTGLELMANAEVYKWLRVNTSGNFYYYKMDVSENQGESQEDWTWNARLSTTIFLGPLTRFQADGMYYGPKVTAQGSSEDFYGINAAIRQDLFNRKLTATLQVRDIFGTMSHQFTSNTETFTNSVRFKREPQIVMLSLSYKFNNFKQTNRRDMENGDPGNGGGMEMEGGF